MASSKTLGDSRPAETIDLITCEYPPAIGGIGDYTRQVAEGLSECGHAVRVWTQKNLGLQLNQGRFQVSDSLGSFGPKDIWRTQKLWNQAAPRRQILLQWSPTGYGFRGINLLIPLWLAFRVLQGDTLRVMFHEGFYVWRERKLSLKAASLIQRLMAAILINSAKESFVATQYLGDKMSRLNMIKDASIWHLPVPSNVTPSDRDNRTTPATNDNSVASPVRVGYFGTYHPGVLPLLVPTLHHLLQTKQNVTVQLIGAGSEVYRSRLSVHLQNRVSATGPCSLAEISNAILCCDLMFQPYPDGLSTRRTTAMAALAHGKMLVSNVGDWTEKIWTTTNTIRLLAFLTPADMAEELSRIATSLTSNEMNRVNAEARDYYERNFSIRHVIRVISNCYSPKQSLRSGT